MKLIIIATEANMSKEGVTFFEELSEFLRAKGFNCNLPGEENYRGHHDVLWLSKAENLFFAQSDSCTKGESDK